MDNWIDKEMKKLRKKIKRKLNQLVEEKKSEQCKKLKKLIEVNFEDMKIINDGNKNKIIFECVSKDEKNIIESSVSQEETNKKEEKMKQNEENTTIEKQDQDKTKDEIAHENTSNKYQDNKMINNVEGKIVHNEQSIENNHSSEIHKKERKTAGKGKDMNKEQNIDNVVSVDLGKSNVKESESKIEKDKNVVLDQKKDHNNAEMKPVTKPNKDFQFIVFQHVDPPKYSILTNNVERDRPLTDRINTYVRAKFEIKEKIFELYPFHYTKFFNTDINNYMYNLTGKITYDELFQDVKNVSDKYNRSFQTFSSEMRLELDLLIKDIYLNSKHNNEFKLPNQLEQAYDKKMFEFYITYQDIAKMFLLDKEVKENFDIVLFYLKKIVYEIVIPNTKWKKEKNTFTSWLKNFISDFVCRMLDCYKDSENRILFIQVLFNTIYCFKSAVHVSPLTMKERLMKCVMTRHYLFTDAEIQKFFDNIEIVIDYTKNKAKGVSNIFYKLFNAPFEKYELMIQDSINNHLVFLQYYLKDFEVVKNNKLKDWKSSKFTLKIIEQDEKGLICHLNPVENNTINHLKNTIKLEIDRIEKNIKKFAFIYDKKNAISVNNIMKMVVDFEDFNHFIKYSSIIFSNQNTVEIEKYIRQTDNSQNENNMFDICFLIMQQLKL